MNPYLAIETLEDMTQRGRLGNVSFETALKNFKKSINKGLLKVFSKMGISTLQSYRGAQVFEAIGLNQDLISHYFTGTASRIGGIAFFTVFEQASTTMSLSISSTFNAATAVALSCSGPAGVTATYANMIATQVKSQARAAG